MIRHSPLATGFTLIGAMVRALLILLIPAAAYAHGEEIFLFFDTVLVVALVGIILLTNFSKIEKLLMSVLLIVIHLIGFSAVVYSETIATIIDFLINTKFEVIGILLILSLLYIIPFFLSLILGNILTKNRNAKS